MVYQQVTFCALSIIGVILSKSWQETLPVFLNQYAIDSILANSLITNSAFGLTIGAILAGIVTNILGPHMALPLNLSVLALSSAVIAKLSTFVAVNYNTNACIYMLGTPILGISSAILLLRLFMIIRGILMAMAMNAAYALVAATYAEDKLKLGSATSTLYILLSLSLGATTLLARYTIFFALLMVLCLLTAVALLIMRSNSNIKTNTRTNLGFYNELREYRNSFFYLLQDRRFVLACFVSMLCVGGFLNCIYLLRKVNFVGLALLQSQGRIIGLCGMLITSNAYRLVRQITAWDYSDFVNTLMPWLTSIPAICMFIIMYGIRFDNIFLIKFGFLMCMCIASASQPLAKWYILSIASDKSREIGKNITGSAQALVTLLNSSFEFIGSAIIFGLTLGGTIYIYLVIAIYITISRRFMLINRHTTLTGNND